VRSTARRVKVTLLGDCRLSVDGQMVAGVPSHFFRIAAYLALSAPDKVMPRHRVSGLLWSDANESKAAANLRQVLARVRHLQEQHNFRFLGGNFSSIYLDGDSDVSCDVVELAQHFAGKSVLSLGELCDLYQGDLMLGLEGAGDAFEEWLAAQRSELRVEMLEHIGTALEQGSQLASSERTRGAKTVLAIDPYNEQALHLLMKEAANQRQLARLEHLYHSMEAVLASDLGIRPSPETQALYRMLHNALRG
jgi:DNA-binding SARP family transcriptional activator